MTVSRISVIIPTLNEVEYLEQSLVSLAAAENTEVIVVDGGSQDETLALAARYKVRLVHTEKGRALQLNAGAAKASGDILLFLHADCLLPKGFDQHVRKLLKTPGLAAGAFSLTIQPTTPTLRFIERTVAFRSKRLHMPYGDQALFLTSDTFNAVGGYPELPIMEDFELVRKLRRTGRIAISSLSVSTSARRWNKCGALTTTLLNQLIIAGYLLGISPEKLQCLRSYPCSNTESKRMPSKPI